MIPMTRHCGRNPHSSRDEADRVHNAGRASDRPRARTDMGSPTLSAAYTEAVHDEH